MRGMPGRASPYGRHPVPRSERRAWHRQTAGLDRRCARGRGWIYPRHGPRAAIRPRLSVARELLRRGWGGGTSGGGGARCVGRPDPCLCVSCGALAAGEVGRGFWRRHVGQASARVVLTIAEADKVSLMLAALAT